MAMTYTRVGDLRGSDKIVHCLLNPILSAKDAPYDMPR